MYLYYRKEHSLDFYTRGNHMIVAAATIVIMGMADGERISIFPLLWPNKTHGV